jgi:hypothetical protein
MNKQRDVTNSLVCCENESSLMNALEINCHVVLGRFLHSSVGAGATDGLHYLRETEEQPVEVGLHTVVLNKVISYLTANVQQIDFPRVFHSLVYSGHLVGTG